MAAIALKTADRVRIEESIEQDTLPVGETIGAGKAVRVDSTTGKFMLADKDEQSGKAYGIAVRKATVGFAVTAIRQGILDGFDLSALAYDDPVYLTDDGTLDSVAGTPSILIGRVKPIFGNVMGDTPHKVLRLELV